MLSSVTIFTNSNFHQNRETSLFTFVHRASRPTSDVFEGLDYGTFVNHLGLSAGVEELVSRGENWCTVK